MQENGECAAGAARAQSSDGANEPGNSKYEKTPSLHCGEFLILKTESKNQSNQGGVFCLSYHTSSSDYSITFMRRKIRLIAGNAN